MEIKQIIGNWKMVSHREVLCVSGSIEVEGQRIQPIRTSEVKSMRMVMGVKLLHTNSGSTYVLGQPHRDTSWVIEMSELYPDRIQRLCELGLIDI
jgi:hypothetical protein